MTNINEKYFLHLINANHLGVLDSVRKLEIRTISDGISDQALLEYKAVHCMEYPRLE